jgi:hypothetical protein
LAAVISQDEMAAKFSSADVLLCSQVSIKSWLIFFWKYLKNRIVFMVELTTSPKQFRS